MKQNPTQVSQLNHAGVLPNLVQALPLRMLTVDLAALLGAQQMVGSHGLLASDALIVALMQGHGITHLATNDDDFDRVPGLSVWKPRP